MITIILLTIRLAFTKDPNQLDYMPYFICFYIERRTDQLQSEIWHLKRILRFENILRD